MSTPLVHKRSEEQARQMLEPRKIQGLDEWGENPALERLLEAHQRRGRPIIECNQLILITKNNDIQCGINKVDKNRLR